MRKPVRRRLLPCLLAAGLLPAMATVHAPQRLFQPPLPRPQEPRAPAGARPSHGPHSPAPAPSDTADQLKNQEFREHVIRDTDDYDPTQAIHDIEVGHFYRVQGDYPGALSRFEEALRHDPNATDAMYEAGEVEVKLHRFDQALNYFERYLEADPQGKHAGRVRSALKKLKQKSERATPTS